ncbi:hypothetical protein P7K49_033967 [Saguinus oedipus]|uniref:Uncharacterized protein n=1 Tax=Saguinus oedipus TaxID=9490 RepID=A0ABQ9TU65_SAGOE|nr:hypothetical protein P7K49_033967 [Saguinus oedipus]
MGKQVRARRSSGKNCASGHLLTPSQQLLPRQPPPRPPFYTKPSSLTTAPQTYPGSAFTAQNLSCREPSSLFSDGREDQKATNKSKTYSYASLLILGEDGKSLVSPGEVFALAGYLVMPNGSQGSKGEPRQLVSPSEQRAMIGDVLNPMAIWDEPLLIHHVFKFISIEFGEASLLCDVDLLVARELELGPAQGLSHMLIVLQLGADESRGQCEP